MTTQGIYRLEDLYEQRFAPLSTLDLSRVSLTVQAYAQFLASDAAEQLNMFSEEQTLSRAVWGGAPAMAFDEVGEFGRGQPRKDLQGQEVHFPLYKLSASQGASEEFWRKANVKNLLDLMEGINIGYSQRIRDEIKAAIFNNTVRTPARDWLVDNTLLNKIQPFLNADSATIPTAPNGKTFTASSHSHYLGITGATVASSDVNYAIQHVTEHVLGKTVLFVDPAMPSTLAGLASTKYVALTPTVVVNQSTTQVAIQSFNPDVDRSNMLVGYWDGYEVYTRSWVPTNYIAVMAVGSQLGMPLHRRIDPTARGLITGITIQDGILNIKESHFYMGFGAFNRAAGLVLDCATGNGSYTVPSGLARS